MATKKKTVNYEFLEKITDSDKTVKEWIKERSKEFDSVRMDFLKFVYNCGYTYGKQVGLKEARENIEAKLGIQIDFGKN